MDMVHFRCNFQHLLRIFLAAWMGAMSLGVSYAHAHENTAGTGGEESAWCSCGLLSGLIFARHSESPEIPHRHWNLFGIELPSVPEAESLPSSGSAQALVVQSDHSSRSFEVLADSFQSVTCEPALCHLLKSSQAFTWSHEVRPGSSWSAVSPRILRC